MTLIDVYVPPGYTFEDAEVEYLFEKLLTAYASGNQEKTREIGRKMIDRMVERQDEEWENPERFTTEPDPHDVMVETEICLKR